MAIDIAGTYANLLNKLYADYRSTEQKREERYGAGLSELGQMTGLFGPGYGAGMERTALAGAKQSLIGRGLGGTTRPMAVGAGLKASFEDLRRGKMAEALSRTAEYRRTFPEGTATAGVLSHLATGGFGGVLGAERLDLAQQQALAAGVPVGGGRTYGGTYGASSFPDMFSIPGERGGGIGGDVQPLSDPSLSDMAGTTGIGGRSTWERPDITFEEPIWGASEQWRSEQMVGEEQPAGVPTSLAVGAEMAGMLGKPTGGVWKRGDYAEWLRVTGTSNSLEALKAFNAAKGTPK